MKMIVLVDWSDDQKGMPERPGCTQEVYTRYRPLLRSFEFWRRKQSESHRIVVWHTHFPWRFTPPAERAKDAPLPHDCEANLFAKMVESVAKNYSPDEPIFVADDSFVFTDDLDLEPFIAQAMQPNSGVVTVNNAWILSPKMQRLIGNLDDTGAPHSVSSEDVTFEDDWTEADFLDWVGRTTWTFAKTYAETAPHEYAVLGKPNTELRDLYMGTMFILRNGFVQMFYNTPFMAYEVANRRYWSCASYDLINRTLEGDLKTYV